MEKTADVSKRTELPISYHTFIYPFIYKEKLEEWISRDEDRWVQIHLHQTGADVVSPDSKQRLLEFNEYQYFLPKARALLFSENVFDWHVGIKGDTGIYYKYKIEPGKATYKIVKKIEDCCFINKDALLDEYKEKNGYYVTSYDLSINRLTLLLLPRYKIGIFSFELEYYEGNKKYAFLSDSSDSRELKILDNQEISNLQNSLNKEETIEQQVNIINNYGRRVGVPCLGEEKNNKTRAILNADQIIISGLQDDGAEAHIAIDFNELAHDADLDISMELISKILFRVEKEPKRYNLKPVLDDRMFTACLYRNSFYSPLNKASSIDLRNNTSSMNSSAKGDTYCYLVPELYRDEAEQLYQFVFLEDDIACYNIHMLKDKLKEHVLGRWVDVGTVHAATEYSLVCVTGEDASLENKVINPFLTQYVDMVKLALAQRAIITNIEYEGQRISKAINGQDKANQESESFLNDVEEVWQKYISFENQVYLPEVTFQEQGVEIYDIIKRSLRIKELNDYVKEGLINLHNIATLKAERNRIRLEKEEQYSNDLISKNLNILSIVGISLALVTFVVNLISAGQMFVWDGDLSNLSKYIVLSICQFGLLIILIRVFYNYYKKKLIEHSAKWINNRQEAYLSQKEVKSISAKIDNIKSNKEIESYINDIWKEPARILRVFIIVMVILSLIVHMIFH